MSPALWLPESRRLRLVLQAAVVVVVVSLVGLGGWFWYRAQESRGELALAQASSLVQQAQAPGAGSEARDGAIKALEAVIADYPRLSTFSQAAYQLGNLRYAAGQYPAARAAYELALLKGAAGGLRTLSGLGIAYTWEAEKNYPHAMTAYEAALRGLAPKDFLYEEVLMDLARVQELAGQQAAALETYRRVIRDVPGSPRAHELKARVASLQSRVKP